MQKKMQLLADVFEMDANEISSDMKLESIENWDSMTKLALIVMIEEEYGKIISSESIRLFSNIDDILKEME